MISLTIVSVAAAKLFMGGDPNLYVGMLTTVLTFWSQPPKLIENNVTNINNDSTPHDVENPAPEPVRSVEIKN
jgi:hypothetical protein